MDKDRQTVHYCTILSDEQWDFILEGRFSVQRQRCLHRLMTHAVRTKTVCNIKGIEITLEVGEVAASNVELAKYLKCNRKTIGKLIDSFIRLGVLTTRTNNRTSIHTLHFLTGWYVGGVLLTIPIMSSHQLMSKNWRTESGHLFLMIRLRIASRVPCRTVAKVKGRKRTPRKAVQHLFLLPFVPPWLATIGLAYKTTRVKQTISLS